jgi:hypothetical protein
MFKKILRIFELQIEILEKRLEGINKERGESEVKKNGIWKLEKNLMI